MNKAYNMCLITRLPGKYAPVDPAVGLVVGNSPGSRANNIYSPGSDKLKCNCTHQLKPPNQKIKKKLFSVREDSD